MKQITDSWKFIITIILSVGAIIYAEGRRAEKQELLQQTLKTVETKVDTVFDLILKYDANIQRVEKNQIEFGIDLYYLQDSYKKYLKLREKDLETYIKLTEGLRLLENDVRSRYNIQKEITKLPPKP